MMFINLLSYGLHCYSVFSGAGEERETLIDGKGKVGSQKKLW